MAGLYLRIIMMLGSLLVGAATGELVAVKRYDLLVGPAELVQVVFSLGDLVDDKMALQSALARNYGVSDPAQAIRELSDCYNKLNPVVISKPALQVIQNR